MNIVDKTRTRIVNQILNALGAINQPCLSEEAGVELLTNDTIHEVFRWHEKQGVFIVSTVISVNVTKTQIKGQAPSL